MRHAIGQAAAMRILIAAATLAIAIPAAPRLAEA